MRTAKRSTVSFHKFASLFTNSRRPTASRRRHTTPPYLSTDSQFATPFLTPTFLEKKKKRRRGEKKKTGLEGGAMSRVASPPKLTATLARTCDTAIVVCCYTKMAVPLKHLPRFDKKRTGTTRDIFCCHEQHKKKTYPSSQHSTR